MVSVRLDELTRENEYLRGQVDHYIKIIENQVSTTDKVVITQKESSDLLWSFYDLIFAVDNCKNFEDLKQWVNLDLEVLNPICIGNIEQVIGNVGSSPIKFSGKHGNYMELVNRVMNVEVPTVKGEMTKFPTKGEADDIR